MKAIYLTITLLFILATSFKMSSKFPHPDEPKLTKLSCSFHTNDDNKDWNTQLSVDIFYKDHGRTIAELLCCSSDKPHGSSHGSTFDDNKDAGTWNLPVKEALTKQEFNQAMFEVGIKASGNDRWKFDARLHAEFSDHTTRDYTWFGNDLNSTNSQRTSKSFPLGDHFVEK